MVVVGGNGFESARLQRAHDDEFRLRTAHPEAADAVVVGHVQLVAEDGESAELHHQRLGELGERVDARDSLLNLLEHQHAFKSGHTTFIVFPYRRFRHVVIPSHLGTLLHARHSTPFTCGGRSHMTYGRAVYRRKEPHDHLRRAHSHHLWRKNRHWNGGGARIASLASSSTKPFKPKLKESRRINEQNKRTDK